MSLGPQLHIIFCLNENTKIREKPNVREKQVTKKFWEAPNKQDWDFWAF